MINNSKRYSYVIFIFILPIILANQFYVDDIGRTTVGYTKWGVDGRPVADIVMSVLNLSSRIVDLAPLPIILASVLLAISFACYRKRFLDGENGALLYLWHSWRIQLLYQCSLIGLMF